MTSPGERLDENDEKAKAKSRDLPESNRHLRGSGYDQTLLLQYVRAKRRPSQEMALVPEEINVKCGDLLRVAGWRRMVTCRTDIGRAVVASYLPTALN
ncbi:unnamed protein product [Peniophora sp. CBMAI 1063]|nr:unnamed protein product [Peniophora sp. CBMAI 1063]